MILHPFLNVLNYLHQNCVAHRDIKPENVSVMGRRGCRVSGCEGGSQMREPWAQRRRWCREAPWGSFQRESRCMHCRKVIERAAEAHLLPPLSNHLA